MGGFAIDGMLYSDVSNNEPKLTLRDKLRRFFCWISYGHDYIPIDSIIVSNKRYYFRVCKRCEYKDEGFG